MQYCRPQSDVNPRCIQRTLGSRLDTLDLITGELGKVKKIERRQPCSSHFLYLERESPTTRACFNFETLRIMYAVYVFFLLFFFLLSSAVMARTRAGLSSTLQ